MFAIKLSGVGLKNITYPMVPLLRCRPGKLLLALLLRLDLRQHLAALVPVARHGWRSLHMRFGFELLAT